MCSTHTNGAAVSADSKMPTAKASDGEKPPVIDAGLRDLDHYKRALPPWRYNLRQWALPLIRWETPYLAYLQDTLRTPALDSYFAITANLGTHTFFMVGLPIMFWCGFESFGKGLVRILALGVFFTGFIKDFFSLPRPLSPPLQRITMSGSAALEYGFPSTHSANAVSVAVYGLLCLHSPDNLMPPNIKLGLEILSYFYAASIIFGRLYCGMHGFVDVVIGSIMGAVISLGEFYYGPALDMYLYARPFTTVLCVVLVIIALVRVHPEPADDCPCFDDSVAFAGVMIGLEIGTWHFAHAPHGLIRFDLEALGWPVVVLRIVTGVLAVFVWREAAKPVLLRSLPHFFRIIETWGMNLPRRFFTPASKYKNIPLRLQVDNVLPNVSDFPNFVNNIRKGGRGRSVSIGPQSAADAYETLAYRDRRRRESNTSNTSRGLRSKESVASLRGVSPSPITPSDEKSGAKSSAISSGHQNKLGDYERMMGEGTVLVTPSAQEGDDPTLVIGSQDELSEREVFAQLIKPRVRLVFRFAQAVKVWAICGSTGSYDVGLPRQRPPRHL
ncbi:PAP2 superfamily protein [Apiospora rasikravindrae]|uniref:PAP2 superfamily protein n=1 Tax=Apiospora rasikravindrae TaxID=990691 RepID=A0ABR1SWQ5_9PEZI